MVNSVQKHTGYLEWREVKARLEMCPPKRNAGVLLDLCENYTVDSKQSCKK